MKRRFTRYPVTASYKGNKIVLSKSRLTQQFTDAFNKTMGGELNEGSDPASEYLLRIDIKQDGDAVVVDIEAETYFDATETPLDYSEYRAIMREFGETNIQTKDEYYQSMWNRETLENAMDKVIKSYNPDWYFELYNACRIQAYLDDAVLKA